ncbi:MAG TPA: hypothetical protein VFC38_06440 [Stellaceae bacterium]|nr:hypothetical protein [Stellaceae bacterium]
MKKGHGGFLVAGKILSALVAFLCSFATAHAALAGEAGLYSTLYPYYAEVCALSQILKKPGFGADLRGGPGGHSVLYLNGVRRKTDAHYPTLEMVDPAASSAQQGVGVSVNDHFRNVNWIAVDGPDFFFSGGLSPSARVTHDAYRQTQARAKAMGIYDGVEFRDWFFNDMPPGTSKRDWMYEISVSTDYAIDFGRDRYCARVPLDRAKMSAVVDYLNGVNDLYKSGKTEYVWNVLQNNCSHLTHNALAAAGVWDHFPTNKFVLFAAFDFPVPKNEFINQLERTNDLPLANLLDLYADPAARQSLMRENWLPTEPGALAQIVHARKNNDVYDTDVKLIFYDWPLFEPYHRQFDEIEGEPRYFDIRANLAYFAKLYQTILAARKPIAWYVKDAAAHHVNRTPQLLASPLERRDFAAFYDRFYRYVSGQQEAVQATLAALPRGIASNPPATP